MALDADPSNFNTSLGCVVEPAVAGAAAQLSSLALSDAERGAVTQAIRDSAYAGLHSKLSRVLVLELNAARVNGRLRGSTREERWHYFLDLSSKPRFWDEISSQYPTLRARAQRIIANRCHAAYLFSQRWASDRDSLSQLCSGEGGELVSVRFDAGDTHGGGQTVAIVHCDGGHVVYKPRSLAVDTSLRSFVAELARECPFPVFMRTPRVLERGDYGWAEFIEHRYAKDERELSAFYRGIGQWLSLMRLLGGTDLHAENLIAGGSEPVVVDCETLFTPEFPPHPTQLGNASDKAARLVSGTVLGVGLLPARGQGLGWRGIDTSGVGLLPGEQPTVMLPAIIDSGTDEARIGLVPTEVQIGKNHPTDEPTLASYWTDVLSGFDELNGVLRRLDEKGDLRHRLDRFNDCTVRVVLRPTETYAELLRMLWHPVSLHNEREARAKAADLLRRMADNIASAPGDAGIIDAEVKDLLIGDIPFFSANVRDGAIKGPEQRVWKVYGNLVERSYRQWRSADLALERAYVRAALVNAYINDGWTPESLGLWCANPRHDDLDARRRQQMAQILRTVIDAAIPGEDGTVTWIAPTLTRTGWSVQSFAADLYGGLSGAALLFAAYILETRAGRADPVEGADTFLTAILRTLDCFEDKLAQDAQKGAFVRPPPAGGYVGLGSQLWARLALFKLGNCEGAHLESAIALGREIPRAAAADEVQEVLYGAAGAIPPLLALYRETQDPAFLNIASDIGNRTCAAAKRDGERVFWPRAPRADGIGGFAHGATGLGWALAQLAQATGNAQFADTARGAFAFEDSLFDDVEQNWLDLRLLGGPKTAAAWCHGSVGIGLARLDLDTGLNDAATERALMRAVNATTRLGLGWNHCICHGDCGAFELLEAGIRLGLDPQRMSQEALLAAIVTSLEDNGVVCGLTKDVVTPALFTGTGGVAYQLLRAHPESELPSVLLLGGAMF